MTHVETEKAIQVLKHQRTQLKAFLTRNKTFLSKLHLENLDKGSIQNAEIRYDSVTPVLDKFQDIQCKLIELDPTSVQDDNLEEFEESYFEIMSKLKSIIKHKYSDPQITPAEASEVSEQGELASQLQKLADVLQERNAVNEQRVQLPAMKLPVFSGDYSRWIEFRDTFKALIHSNEKLSAVEKFYYLRSSLQGDALEVIQALPTTEANYAIAMSLLADRFESSNTIVQTHLRAIIEYPHFMKESYKELRNLYDTYKTNIRALDSLNEPVKHWGTILIYIITSKFDFITRREWESISVKNNSSLKIEDLEKFLEYRCSLLEKIDATRARKVEIPTKSDSKFKNHRSNLLSTERAKTNGKISCFFCSKDHSIYNCSALKGLPVSERIIQTKALKLCQNCLKPFHSVSKCTAGGCKKCNSMHNSILHDDFRNKADSRGNFSPRANQVNDKDSSELANRESSFLNHHSIANNQVLLSTVSLLVTNSHGNLIKCRALLDNGAMSNFITSSLCKKLQIKSDKIQHTITGIGSTNSVINQAVKLRIRSSDHKYRKEISCFVLDKITDNIPTVSFNVDDIQLPSGIALSDSEFNRSLPIDMLLSAAIFWDILQNKQIKLENNLVIQLTKLGWVIGGSLNFPLTNSNAVNCLSVDQRERAIEDQVSKFWEIEELPNASKLSNSDQYCEKHFSKTYRRNESGQFIVHIPFKPNYVNLGSSRDTALKRFLKLERSLNKSPELKKEYTNFMREYESMSHMREVREEGGEEELNYYLPHHAVVKDSITTKIRVVFDGSAKTTSGLSLNDVQYTGPTIQQDLFSIILRFRTFKYVMAADISKMYRMVLVQNEQTKFQRILWRYNTNEKIKCYELLTVTYGTSSGSYLAIRSLQELAHLNKLLHPQASQSIIDDFYVDDYLTGSDSSQELLELQSRVTKILAEGGFKLRKWMCNEAQLLQKFVLNDNLEANIIKLGEDKTNETLGIAWNASKDNILYTLCDFDGSKLTKRTILSQVAQIFDPLGLLGPVIMQAKLLLQILWQQRVGWDQPISKELSNKWIIIRDDLSFIKNLSIPRHVICNDYQEIELHAFGDASEAGYGGCVYIRSKRSSNEYSVHLLCSKSRVAPLKRLTLPRLELRAALLVSQLVSKVTEALNNIKFNKIVFWSDSSITLAWIKGCPSRWKTFVANRVSQIQNLSNTDNWHHVSSKDNPADLISRGTSANNLKSCQLWWTGPSWLKYDFELVEFENDNHSFDIPEAKTINLTSIRNSEFINEFLEKYSNLRKIKRIFAYVLRLVEFFKTKDRNKLVGRLTVKELENSLNIIIKSVQINCFGNDYKTLVQSKGVLRNSPLVSLNPMMDENELIRVGGRLRFSSCQYDKKHPIILPSKHRLTALILEQYHKDLLHGGPSLMIAAVREKYWPLNGRTLAKRVSRSCVTCFRAKPSSDPYLMGNLPKFRVNQCIPFTNTGVDYGGPFMIKDRFTRNARLMKAYLCLFICLTTKAIHLEVVTDLTTASFLSTLKRFIGRRGKPSNIYSDNGSNFVGANSELKALKCFLADFDGIENNLANDGISWHFIPARSPSFGGIWEAGIKSAKHHMKRLIGNANLTYEQFQTVLVQIESILNSRPICPLLSDPDLTPLTPGHFLIGKTMSAIPEPSYLETKENRLKIFQRLQRIIQAFWKRWHLEYLGELQSRSKWKQDSQQYLREGAVVLVKEENSSPLNWPIGRITRMFPGQDGIIRVVEVKINNYISRRAVSKICLYPFEKLKDNDLSRRPECSGNKDE